MFGTRLNSAGAQMERAEAVDPLLTDVPSAPILKS